MYIRFSTMTTDEDSGCRTGVFSAAYDLRDSVDTPRALSDSLRRALRWFDEHLPAPGRVSVRAIFWFKPQAHEQIRATWEMVNLLHECGRTAFPVKCERPGRIIYEDDYQVATIPFRDVRDRL